MSASASYDRDEGQRKRGLDIRFNRFRGLATAVVVFAIFMVVKAINSMKRKEEAAPAAPPEPSAEVKLLTEIRDSLRKD